MKRNPGRMAVLLLAFACGLWGASYEWKVLGSPQTLQVGEPGVVRYECTFSDSAAEYTIDFKPAGTEAYEARILTQRDRVTQGRRIQTFDVLITPKKAGGIDVRLGALVRHTTFASIENATIGRDNVKRYDFNDEAVSLPPVAISTQHNSADLTGRITLEAQADKNMVRAFEPVHLSVRIKGAGNLEQFVPYELNISGVRVFEEPPQKSLVPSAEGFEGEIRQEFALVSEKSFTIPSLELNVFDTAGRKPLLLKTQPIAVEVAQGYTPSSLLDPPDLGDTATLKRYALYAALVVLGMVLAEAFRWLWRRRPRRRPKRFWDGAKNSKELALWLALSGEKRYESIIAGLESGTLGLGEAKAKLSTLTSDNEVKK